MDGNNQSQDVQKRLDELRRKRRELEKRRRRISQTSAPSDDAKSGPVKKEPVVEKPAAPTSPPPEKAASIPKKPSASPAPSKTEIRSKEPTVPFAEPPSERGKGRMIGILAGAGIVVAIALIILLGGKDGAPDQSEISGEAIQSEGVEINTDAGDLSETTESIDEQPLIQEDGIGSTQDIESIDNDGLAADPGSIPTPDDETPLEDIAADESGDISSEELADDTEFEPVEEAEPVPAAPRLVDPEEERLDEALQPIKRIDPVDYAKEMELTPSRGLVLLQITIGTDGLIEDAVVVRSLDEASDAIAVDAVKQWEFTPPMLNGEPVRVLKRIPVTFR